ncbi:zinc-ribbon domain-containing protein [Youngiibacter multivorans]|uniref:RNA-binding Zn-ribbon protein involved in translation (DUF1610 family) n=1 Tax=Youngiibacter multivorans TaxID=937251 RepID=A0ABS4G858_9CLOT|nr:zinc-ribbon domain-containing protein [Youngiibacter multivorans]MBP1920745.1 putative RNA-binding Zn-ribbon protein involved in translation (DUF1610 family) [Youngiibacter multivorans]
MDKTISDHICPKCGPVFELNAEAGKEFEEGKSGAISQRDMTRIGPQGRTGLVTCSSCGVKVENSYRFCPHCGNPLT